MDACRCGVCKSCAPCQLPACCPTQCLSVPCTAAFMFASASFRLLCSPKCCLHVVEWSRDTTGPHTARCVYCCFAFFAHLLRMACHMSPSHVCVCALLPLQMVIGGTNINRERSGLASSRCDLLIATPGRLNDHLESTPGFAGRLWGVQVREGGRQCQVRPPRFV